jgi:hypothetical protein
MRLHDGCPVGIGAIQPPRERTEWETRARKAFDRWTVAAELNAAFSDGIRHAATIAEKTGHSAFGMELRKLADKA